MRKTLTLAVLAAVAIGCGGRGVQEPRVPGQAAAETAGVTPPGANGSAESQIWALPTEPRDPKTPAAETKDVRTDAWSKAVKVKGVPATPATCAAFAKPGPVKPAPADLAAAIVEKDAVKRNAMLAAVEAAKPEIADVIRAMRAELAPIECADAITDPPLTAAKGSVAGAPGQMTVGLSLASKLSRTAASAPSMKDASDKEKVKRFIQGPLREWMVEQATAIDALSAPAGELTGIARGVVAMEAGMADLRLVDRIRSAPTPSTWDKELRAVYEAALDEALEPRKARGRDAALVGLADFAAAGIVHDARVDRTRALLSKLYGGRRIDALDALLLPDTKASASTVPESVLALLPGDASKREAFTQLGLSAPPARQSARARLEMGQRYWRRVDFVEAAHAAAGEPESEDTRLVLAVALALAKGPNGAKEMMAAPSPAALHLTNTDALDALAAEAPARIAGMAAYDAAHLRSLSPPDGDAAGAYLADVAARFKRAAGLLEDPAQKRRAEERAAEADAIAKATGKPAGTS